MSSAVQTPTAPIENITIRPMLPSHLTEVVGVHLESFPGFFLAFLGCDFLTLLYRGILSDPGGLALVACSSSETAGFVAGVMDQSGFYQRLIEGQKWTFAAAALGAVLRRPAIAPRLLRALQRSTAAQQNFAEACLMSIAVLPEYEGRNIGKRLVEAFCQELAARAVPAVSLTTDRDHNERANRFYQGLGFSVNRTYVTPEGRAMNEYVILLDGEGSR